MAVKGSGSHVVYWKTQKPIDYLDTTLTINTYEEVTADLSGGRPARLWYILLEQTNNGATQEDLTLEITINGTAYEFTITATSGTQYHCIMSYDLTTGDFTPAVTSTDMTVGSSFTNFAVPFDAASVGLIRVKQTTDVDGTSAQIEVNIIWEKLVPIA